MRQVSTSGQHRRIPVAAGDGLCRPVRGAAPNGDSGQGAFWPLSQRGKAADVNRAGIPIQRQEITLVQKSRADTTLAKVQVNFRFRAGDEADLAKLARHDRSMGCTPARSGENAGGKRHALDVRRHQSPAAQGSRERLPSSGASLHLGPTPQRRSLRPCSPPAPLPVYQVPEAQSSCELLIAGQCRQAA